MRQMTMVGFLQAQNCTNLASSWRHPLSRTPGRVEHAGPERVGQHNEEVYCGRLGLSRDDLAALARKGVV